MKHFFAGAVPATRGLGAFVSQCAEACHVKRKNKQTTSGAVNNQTMFQQQRVFGLFFYAPGHNDVRASDQHAQTSAHNTSILSGPNRFSQLGNILPPTIRSDSEAEHPPTTKPMKVLPMKVKVLSVFTFQSSCQVSFVLEHKQMPGPQELWEKEACQREGGQEPCEGLQVERFREGASTQ